MLLVPHWKIATIQVSSKGDYKLTKIWKQLFAVESNETECGIPYLYYPGDIGFDPFGLKPKNGADFEKMATKEIQNGRLAMFGAAGMLVQEQVTHEPIMQTLQHLF